MSAYTVSVPEEKLVTLKIKLGQSEFPDEVQFLGILQRENNHTNYRFSLTMRPGTMAHL